MNEEKLIHLCRKKDRKAQKALYELYDDRMFRVVWRYIRDQQEAEDVHLKAFFKVFQNISRFDYRGEGSLAAWMRRIMVNEALMFLRKKRFEWQPVEEAHGAHSEDHPDDNLNAEDIIREIRDLPVGFRTVFNLFAIEGYAHEEIAEKLGISVGTSRSQLSRARALLRQKLSQIGLNHETHRQIG